MKSSLSYAVAALLLGTAAQGTPAAAMTLEEALAAAYVTNPTLQAQRAAVRATDEEVPQALSGWRPTITTSASFGRTEVDTETGGVATERDLDSRDAAIVLTQPLFRGFRTVNAVDAAENTVLAARSELTSTEQSVLLSAAQAYMDVLRDMAVLELNINNQQVLRRQLEAARDRFQVGEITRTDVSQAESRLAGAIADRIAAEAQLESARATFERIVGVPPEDLRVPDVVPNLPTSLEQAVALAVESQPEVLAAVFNSRAALESVDVVRGELWPEVSLQAVYEQAWDTTVAGDERETTQLVANLTFPLYQSGAVYSRLRQAKHTAGQRRLEVDQAQVTAREAAIQAWEALQSARAQIESISSQVEAAQVALEGVQREAQVGARTVLDVLDAEQELLDARVNLVRAERNERVAAFELLAAVGRLTAGSLDLPVEIYDPSVHYRDVRNQWIGGSIWAERDEAGEPIGPELVGAEVASER